MRLVRDVLDKQLLDWHNEKLGKVDGIVLQVSGDQPPRVVYLEAGATTLGRRLGRRVGGWVAALARRWGGEHPHAYRIPWTRVRRIEIDIRIDLEAEATRVYALEDWLRVHVVERLPFGKSSTGTA
ncbi:MAG: hypothetical protein H0U85_07680 [Gemmatimonadales bacterium]|nr:hypothetical protein [Gemmatimonadales bacterium]